LLGFQDQALRRDHQALALARELSHPYTLGYAMFVSDFLSQLHGRPVDQSRAEALMTLSREQEFPLWFGGGQIYHGAALVAQGQTAVEIAEIQEGLAIWRATGAEVMRPYFLSLLAEAYAKDGHAAEGMTVLAEALAIAEKQGERWFEAELHRLKGEALLAYPERDQVGVEACFHRAIGVARQQGAKLWELRACTSLARLWRDQGERQQAHDLLAPVYGWFTEGFGTLDLKEAKALLEQLKA
jgi:predicted ATPase